MRRKEIVIVAMLMFAFVFARVALFPFGARVVRVHY